MLEELCIETPEIKNIVARISASSTYDQISNGMPNSYSRIVSEDIHMVPSTISDFTQSATYNDQYRKIDDNDITRKESNALSSTLTKNILVKEGDLIVGKGEY